MSSGKLKGHARKERGKGKLLATPSLTPDYVQMKLEERVGVQLPPQIAQAILKTSNFRRIHRVAHTLKKIISSSRHNSEAAINRFGNSNLARLLVLHPGAFFMVARAAREGTSDALAALSHRELASAFAKNPAKISSAITRIARAAGKEREGAFFFLSQKAVASAFARSPKTLTDAFVRIGRHVPEAFWALATEEASREFAKEPTRISRALRRVGKITGNAAGAAIWAIERDGIFPAFLENPAKMANMFSKISRSAGKGAWDAFRLIGSEQVAPLFAKNPGKVADAMARIGAAAGEYGEHAFSLLKNFAADFAKNPSKVAGTFEELCNIYGRRAGAAFALMSKKPIAKELSKDISILKKLAEASTYTFIFIGLTQAEKSGDPKRIRQALSLLNDPKKLIDGYGVSNLVAHRNKWEAGRKLAREAGVKIEDREVFINFAYAKATIGSEAAIAIHKEYGIEYFARYSKEELESLYNHISEWVDERPLLLMAYNKCDGLNVFYDAEEFGVRDELVEKGHYNIIFVEAEDEREFYEKAEKFGEKYNGISSLLVAGHGTEGTIRLGPGETEERFLDLSDEEEIARLSPLFAEKPQVILASCATGKGKNSIGAQISRSWGAELHASEVPTVINSFKLDKQGKIIKPVYRRGGKVFVNGVEK
jgi:hypothetical protein